MKNLKTKTIKFSLLTAIFILLPCLVFASSTDGTIDSTYKTAWNEDIGLINFGATNGDVHVTDSGLSGLCWSANYGWISLDDVVNDGEGNLSGMAWGEHVGWISFAPTNGGVSIDTDGEFSGTAWGENIGWIVFDETYKVKTDWRPQSVRPACNNALDDDNDGLTDYPDDLGCESLTDTNEVNPGRPPSRSGGGSSVSSKPQRIEVIINDGSEYTDTREVKLKLFGGSSAAKMSISNSDDFKGAIQIPYQKEVAWELKTPQQEGPPQSITEEETSEESSEEEGVSEEISEEEVVSEESSQEEETSEESSEEEAVSEESSVEEVSDGSSEEVVSEEPSFLQSKDLAGSEHTVFVRFYSESGQLLKTVSDSIILDDTLPGAPVIIYPQNNAIVKTDKPTFYGNAEPNNVINLELMTGSMLLEKTEVVSDDFGKWSYAADFSFAYGFYKVKVFAREKSGNISESVASDFKIHYIVFPGIEIPEAEVEEEVVSEEEEVIEELIETVEEEEKTEDKEQTEKIEETEKLDKPEQVEVFEQKVPVELPKFESEEIIPAPELSKPTEPVKKVEEQKFQESETKKESGKPALKDISEKSKNILGFIKNKIKGFGKGLTESFLNINKKTEEKSSVKKEQRAPQPAFNPEPSIITEEEKAGMKEEVVVIKSDYGNIEITTGEDVVPVSVLSKQTVNLFVKPKENAVGALGQILYVGSTARTKSENQKMTTSEYFFEFLKIQEAFAYDQTVNEKPTGGWKIKEFYYNDEDKDGIFQAKTALPATASDYIIKTLILYENGNIADIDTPLSIDSHGYIYRESKEGVVRISNAMVSFYQQDENTGKYQIWDGSFYNVKNPQTTNEDGTYLFVAPAGKYYMTVQAKGYYDYKSKEFEVKSGLPANFNIELKKRFDWGRAVLVFAGVLGLLVAGWFLGRRKWEKALKQ